MDRQGGDEAGGPVGPPASVLRVDEWWPETRAALVELQERLAAADPEVWAGDAVPIGGCFVCFERGGTGPGKAGDRGWAGAVALSGDAVAEAVTVGSAGAPYLPGMLALREGPILHEAVQRLAVRPEVLLVNATGRDHPRRAGLALHLGAALEIPTVGVTHRPLAAQGGWPADEPAAVAPLTIDGEEVGRWVRTRVGARPVAAHAGWRTDPATAALVVARTATASRTPEPIRRARKLARTRRSREPRR